MIHFFFQRLTKSDKRENGSLDILKFQNLNAQIELSYHNVIGCNDRDTKYVMIS